MIIDTMVFLIDSKYNRGYIYGSLAQPKKVRGVDHVPVVGEQGLTLADLVICLTHRPIHCSLYWRYILTHQIYDNHMNIGEGEKAIIDM